MDPDTPTPGGPTRHILLVEHDPELGRVVREYLSYFKIRAIVAGGVNEAHEQIEDQEFDAYVVDAEVPGAERLGHLDPYRVVLLCSEPHPHSWEQLGVRHFLAKPFDVADLQSILADILAYGGPRSS
jgi:DNA-binding response OmpR family regulator